MAIFYRRTLSNLVAFVTLMAAASPLRAEPIKVGVPSVISDAPLFIAQTKGFFKDEGLEVDIIPFDSAPQMIAPLATGQLDAGGGAISAGLYNAAARGIGIKIVADRARNAPGHGVEALMVRQALIDSGKFKGLKDLRGLKVAVTGKGVNSEAVLNEALKRAGLKYTDVEIVYLGFLHHAASYKNGAIDASITAEPTVSLLVKNALAARYLGTDQLLPNHQTAVLFYGAPFIKSKPEAAKKFMRAYLRGARFYNDALKDGHLAGPKAAEGISILAQSTPIKDSEIYRALTSHACDPDGRINIASISNDWRFFKETGQIDGTVLPEQLVDTSFAVQAAKELGPYRPAP